jgi:hypothetical protein
MVDSRGRARAGPALALVAALAAPLAIGCDLTMPGLRKPEGPIGTIGGRSGRLVEPKRCTLTVVMLTRPQGDPVLNQVVWQAADEQVTAPELRRALQANGLRIGRISGELPRALEDLLRAGPPDIPDVQTIANPSGQSALIDAAHAAPRPQLNLLLSHPDGSVKGKPYRDARGLMRLTATHEPAGVSLRIVPEVHHGPMRQGFGMVPHAGVATPHEFQMVSGQDEETFRDLSATLMIGRGQIAVLGARPERPGSLGDLLFQRPEANSDRVLQTLVLIWAGRNEGPSDGEAGHGAEPPDALLPVDPQTLPGAEGGRRLDAGDRRRVSSIGRVGGGS